MASLTSSFRSITVIGTGLIGGSWGLALKGRGFAGRIIGCDRSRVLARARELNAIDEGEENVLEAVRTADLVILAMPVGAALQLLPQLKKAAAAKALVTDTGSTKRAILKRAGEVLGEEPLFLGGHPLAGKEQSGIDNANASLFEGAGYVLAPLSAGHLEDRRVRSFAALVEGVGARVLASDAETHDRALAYLSHLPQLLSTGLASVIAEEDGRNPLPLEFAASGFRDMTRLAESPEAVWRDIWVTNSDNIRSALDLLIEKLETMKAHLDDGNLAKEFEQALRLREHWRRLR
jgi:prephenate dehydrogenase